ncbi:acyltransferase [Sporosarcina sp. PTS2304]|uniref:acyltransferase family protein n=1 Tax=Sporosarcina sp. PTS2304 TaxID=2283194 RepID=UPI000E0DBF7F|nr:acyltransferase family protein [Sporosarcina sp. PTS2304]AXH98841.1 acyltransferase [Sporosarcina sp. PTS2304]
MNDLRSPEKRFRPEIEGVRTIATLLIAIYHIWLGRVSGGIDVFFIISGYLMTLSLLSRIERTGSVGFSNFILGLARRLFPQALFVIVVTGVLSLVFLPKVEWGEIVNHIAASTFYFENWRLAFDAVDYLALDNSASPFQHYWSLGVQGQFYILWPIILTTVYVIARKLLRTPVRKTLLVALVGVCAVSLTYSIYQTHHNQPWAYFDTFTRMWEFSIGGVFALVSPYLRVNERLRTVVGWIGLLIICLTGVLLPVSTVFPGYLAFVPISGVLLILTATEIPTSFGVDRLLHMKPLIYLGGLTYGIYLWHWPLLIFYRAHMNTTSVPIVDGLILLLITIVLSVFSTKLLEKPVLKMGRGHEKRQLIAVLSFMLLITCTSIITISVYIQKTSASMMNWDQTEKDYPGAKSIYYDIEPPEGLEPIPSALAIKTDLPKFYNDAECLGRDLTEVKKCSYGKVDNPAYVLALVGGSHSGHWFPALEILAEELDFRIDVYNHDGCRFTDEDPDGYLTENCVEWNANLIDELMKDPPDLVFTTATLNKHDKVLPGYINQWKYLEDITTIFAIRDNPRMKENIPLCLEKAKDPLDCAIDRIDGISDIIPWENTKGIPSNVIFEDLTDYFCDDTTCYPVIGNVIVYRDNNHLTAEYAKTLATPLKEPLQQAFRSIGN